MNKIFLLLRIGNQNGFHDIQFQDIFVRNLPMQPIQPIKPYMLFFRGKLTVSPNTLNNQIHTYFFAHHWQEQHTIQIFKKNKQKSYKKYPGLNEKRLQIAKKYQELDKEEKQNLQKKGKEYFAKKREELKKELDKEDTDLEFQYTYEKWMKLIQDVAEFNRFYVSCFLKAYPISQANTPINIMDFRAFRLFHDWDVWGDSTSYLQIKATASFDPTCSEPIQNIVSNKNLYLTTKMGTNKCIMANQDTDNQDMSKLFAVTLNMNDQVKFIVQPFVMRPLHFRTVDTLPWTTSMCCLWSGNGKLQLAHEDVKPQAIDPDLKKLLPGKEGWAEMRFLQYRYSHPQKTSSVIGYVMNTANNSSGKLSYINKYWSIVNCSATYTNPSPARTYNGSTNNSTDIEIFLRNVTFDNNNKNNNIKVGILVDLSSAVMDANDVNNFPNLPHYFDLLIYDRNIPLLKKQFTVDEIKNLFHINAGMYLIKDKQLIDKSEVSIVLTEKVYSQQPDKVVQIEVVFKGNEETLNLEIKDKFLKNKEMPLLKILSQPPSYLNEQFPSYKIFQKHITFELYLSSHGQPYSGFKQINLLPAYEKKNSYCNIDPSGLTQYTTNKAYLKTIFANPLDPQERLNQLIKDSKQFREAYKDVNEIDEKVFQGKLRSEIIPLTDSYIKKLFNSNSLQYTFQKNGQVKQFKLSFEQGKQTFQRYVQFVNGYASVNVYLNQNLTWYNNPRHPALESLCLVGQFRIDNKASQTFTAIFFEDPYKNPYEDVDWLHTVGPKLKVMGLIYPAMQNIIDLYNYDGLSMSAMKRAFEIENQNNSRYMPATREMSSVTHRQIRRWLYNPIYDSYIYTSKFNPPNINNLPFKDFTTGKKKLIKLLRDAFKIELTTIPLYLSALYSIKKEGEATRLIRSVAKDQMKHLFIVSNLLNAVGEVPPYPQPNTTSSEFIPQFPLQTSDPIKGLICFHFQVAENQKWKKLMDPLPIQSTIRQQLLRFIMIQMPGQAYLIKIQPLLCFQNQIYNVKKQNSNSLISDFSSFDFSIIDPDLKYKLLQTCSRINELNDAIQAVVLQQQNKRKQKNSLNLQGSIEQDGFMTIGMAYNKILNYLWALNDIDSKNQLFNGDKRKQFTYMYLKDMVEIINLRTSLEQIRQIVQEGQGSSIFNVTGQINTESHFIKFIQIFTGCDLTIQSYFETEQGTIQQNRLIRKGKFIFTPNYKRFPDFPNYNDNIQWDPKTNEKVDKLVNSELQYERLSDHLQKTQFPNTFAPLSFVNNYKKILEELGFIFKAKPQKFNGRSSFEQVRLKSMENTIAKMRQMSLNATHIVNPNDTFDNQTKKYDSASPKYNINQSSYLPPPKDP